jgi:hypothetical protein
LNEPVTVPFLALITTGPLALAVSMPPAVMLRTPRAEGSGRLQLLRLANNDVGIGPGDLNRHEGRRIRARLRSAAAPRKN